MFLRLYQTIERHATWPVTALLVIVMLLCSQGFTWRSGELGYEIRTLDVRGWYTPEDVQQLMAELGESGRQLYAITAVVVGGIGDPPSDQAYAVLVEYLERGGRVFLLVGPRTGDERLTTLLDRWGVKLGGDIIIDQEVRLFEGPKLGVQPLLQDHGKHPITENFRQYSVFPQTRSVEAATTGKKALTATPLARTSASSWAETDVDAVFTQGVAELGPADRRGPVSVALAVVAKRAEMGVATGDDAGTLEARLVVIGSTAFAYNQFFAQRAVNADLVLNAIGWLVGQEETVSIRSRTVRASRAELTADDSRNVFYLSVLIIPELLILFGVTVWWRRRSR